MNNPVTIKNLFGNLGLKLLGLILALLLWFHVATNRDYEIDIGYTLDYANLPDSLALAAPPPAKVTARAHGSGKSLLRTLWQSRHWLIDLSAAHAGSVAVSLDPSQVPLFGIEGVEILDLKGDKQLFLVVDTLAEKTVPIVSDCVWETGPEFVRTGPEEWIPSAVLLTGPKHAVEQITSVTSARLEIRDPSEPVDQEVDLVSPNTFGVTMAPTRARLRQMIEPFVTRELPGLAVRVATTTAHDTFTVVPAEVTVAIGGPRSTMANVVPESISVVCVVSDQDTTGTRRELWVHAPEPLQVLKTTPDSVTVWRHERPRTSLGH